MNYDTPLVFLIEFSYIFTVLISAWWGP